MRQIKKTHPPKLLRDWVKTARDELNFNYNDGLNSYPEAKAELLEQLLSEQFFLYAYVGVEINGGTCHIEHLKPQNECMKGEDVDYFNLVACFPANGGDVSHGFGAPVKSKWWVEDQFVSPLSDGCERRFRFAWSGTMSPASETDTAAEETIVRIGLDCNKLRELRKRAIQGFFGFASKKPLSIPEAERLLAKIDQPNKDGKLPPFCFVLKPLLLKYVASGKIAKQSKRKR